LRRSVAGGGPGADTRSVTAADEQLVSDATSRAWPSISARRPPPGEMAGEEFPFPLDACCPENEKLWSWVNSGVMVVGARIFALFRTHAGSRPARLALSRLDWVVDGPR